jgi:membrane-associated phospholipid phosphatase
VTTATHPRRPSREIAALGLVAALVTAIAIPWLDVPLARAVHGSTLADAAILQQGTWLLNWATGKALAKYTLTVVLALAGAGLLATRHRRVGLGLLFVALVHGLSYLAIGVSKPIFGRLRPDVLLAGLDGSTWFAGGTSFLSGHAAYYFGAGLPLALVWPRWRALWFAVPAFIAVARIDANEHYLSDVCASIALCCAITLVVARLLPRLLAPPTSGTQPDVTRPVA